MKVKKLIKELKKYPQELDVGVMAHDNVWGEVALWVNKVDVLIKENVDYTGSADEEMIESLPDKCIVLY